MHISNNQQMTKENSFCEVGCITDKQNILELVGCHHNFTFLKPMLH